MDRSYEDILITSVNIVVRKDIATPISSADLLMKDMEQPSDEAREESNSTPEVNTTVF